MNHLFNHRLAEGCGGFFAIPVNPQERAEASERRSLRELDQERTARQKSERTADDLRGELAAARSEARDAAVAQAEGRAKLEAQAAALRRAERGEAEAALARQLLATLRVAPRERDGGRRRKVGSSAATAQEETAQEETAQEDQGEVRGNEQEAAALPGNQDDGNDSSDGSDDSKN